MSNTTLIASVTGIGVSGVVGPLATAWASRRANRQQFERDQAAKRRADLRDLVDEGAVLLGAGATRLRMAREAVAAGNPEPEDVTEWATKAHLLKQRLLLRLPPDHQVVLGYDEMLDALEVLGTSDESAYREAVGRFETSRDSFLNEARQTLDAPVAEAE